jgi:UDP-2,3-diacylglucosamine pyrophosphatase LpxH
METLPKLERIRRLTLTPGMKLVCMSDMHRGDGSGADDFAQNSLIYRCALEHYLENGFTYVELGDAEELWENDNFDQIYITHTLVYELLAKFHDPDPVKTRYLKVWGNHDLYWKDNEVVYRSLFHSIEIHEGIVLETMTGRDEEREGGCGAILFIHGHQADPKCNGEMAVVIRFLVHNFWSGLQRFGIKDLSRAALNPGLCNEVDKRLHEWATNNDKGIHAIIAGHTHRAVFENLSLTEQRYLESKVKTDGVKIEHQPDRSYYNTGSCVHPLCITGIEITFENGPCLRLVKWGQATEMNRVMIGRTVLDG